MTRAEAEQAIGKDVWTSYSPKLVKSHWLTGPYTLLKITKAGGALLEPRRDRRSTAYGTITVAIREVFTHEAALAQCPLMEFTDYRQEPVPTVEERQPSA